MGEFAWHQDFARFPHTNYDLVAVTVMLDDLLPRTEACTLRALV
jgi:phytanoyl-CoA hydroxylase